MSARYLNLPSCPHCSKEVQCFIEEDVSIHCTYYTVRCNCIALTTSVTKEAIVQGGEPYAIEVAHQRWKEAVDKSMMYIKENPDSEETGVIDSDAVWEAVINAMLDARLPLMSELGESHNNYTDTYRSYCERILKKRLNDLSEDDDPPF